MGDKQVCIRPELLEGDLTKVDLEDKLSRLPESEFTLEVAASSILARQSKEVQKCLLKKTLNGFIACGKYLQTKMPLKNDVLKIRSCLDPVVRRTAAARRHLLQIPRLTNLVPSEAVDSFQRDVNRYTTDDSPSSAKADAPVDVWWAGVSEERYPVLTKAARGLLSCFHGPLVESAFSEMGDILTKKTNMDLETYSAMQTVKTTLQTRKLTAVKYFAKADPVKEPVSKTLTKNTKRAWIENEKRKSGEAKGTVYTARSCSWKQAAFKDS